MPGCYTKASGLRARPHLHEKPHGAVCCGSCSFDVSMDAQEAQLESDRAEVGSPEQGKGVAGSGRPRYCRKCHVRPAFTVSACTAPARDSMQHLHLLKV